MKVYISIPITGHDLDKQKSYAQAIAEKISDLGYEPVNPFDTPEPETYLSDKERYAYYMGEDVKRLLTCDMMYQHKGWEKSKGCRAERKIANLYGIKCINNLKGIPSQTAELEEKLSALLKEYGVQRCCVQYSFGNGFRIFMKSTDF